MAYSKENLVEDLAGLDLIFATKTAANDTVEYIIDKIIEKVTAGEQVNLSGLCLFKPAIQAARSGKLPGTDTPYTSPEKNVVRITPSAKFERAVAQ